ncbi:MAG: glycosyltransferase [Acidobacteriota bacterium]|nr:glycosyltransferase [Acidobacteriota bacterium]
MPDTKPRVALVHDWLTGMRGGEHVLETIGELFPEAPIYTLLHFPGSVSAALESHPIRTSFLQSAPGVRRHYRKYLPLFPAAIESFDLTAFDLVISTSHCVAKGVVAAPGSFHLCYCHTPMRYAWDQEHVYFPRRHGLMARLRAEVLSSLREWDVSSSARVDQFVANSSFVAQRIHRYYGRGADVVHPPVDTGFFTPATAMRQDYALIVTALAPYKRVELAVEACVKSGMTLRIVGTGPELRRLERAAAGSADFLGRVDDERLRSLYREAACLLQPGVEDFGMTVVEALACDCPVVALGQGGVLDIVENGVHGVLYPEAGNAEALRAAIDKFRDLRSNFVDLRGRAEKFSTERFRSQLRDLLDTRRPT